MCEYEYIYVPGIVERTNLISIKRDWISPFIAMIIRGILADKEAVNYEKADHANGNNSTHFLHISRKQLLRRR